MFKFNNMSMEKMQNLNSGTRLAEEVRAKQEQERSDVILINGPTDGSPSKFFYAKKADGTVFFCSYHSDTYHNNIWESLQEVYKLPSLESMKSFGGAFMRFDKERKKITIEGKSERYGFAPTDEIAQTLQEKYPDYQIVVEESARG